MAQETLYIASSVSGQASNPNNAIGNTPSTWAGDVNNNTSWVHTWQLQNPTISLVADPGTQTFTLRTRKGSNTNNPSISFTVTQGGTTLASSGTVTVTSTTGQDVTATWVTTGGESLENLQVNVTQTATGGSPNARNMAQVAMVTWNAIVNTPLPPFAYPTANDAGVLTVNESISVVSLVSKSASDSGTLSVDDSAVVVPKVPPAEPEIIVDLYLQNLGSYLIGGETLGGIQQDDVVIIMLSHSFSDTWDISYDTHYLDEIGWWVAPGAMVAAYASSQVQNAGSLMLSPSFGTPSNSIFRVLVVRGIDLDKSAVLHGSLAAAAYNTTYTSTTQHENSLSVVAHRAVVAVGSITSSLGTNYGTVKTPQRNLNATSESYGVNYITGRPTPGSFTDTINYYTEGVSPWDVVLFSVEFASNVTAVSSEPVAASDTGTLSATETSNLLIDYQKSASDTGSLSATEQTSSALNTSTTDSGVLSSVESRTIFVTLNRSDTGTLSISDDLAISVTLSSSDSGAISATEASASISYLSASDSGSLATSESTSQFKAISASDAGSLSVIESRTTASTSTRTDTGSLSVTEAATPVILTMKSASDTGAISTTETALISSVRSANDAGSLSVADTASSSGTANRTDSGTLSATETSALYKEISTSDSGTISVTESRAIFNTSSANDSGSISANETTLTARASTTADTGNLSVVESIRLDKSVPISDSGSISVTDVAVLYRMQDSPGTDEGTFSVTESSEVLSDFLYKEISDSGQLSALDEAEIIVSVSVSDTGSLSSVESASSYGTANRADAGSLSVTESAEAFTPVEASDSGTLSATDTSELVKKTGVPMYVWDGTAMIETETLYVFNGTAMVQPIGMAVWTGSEMVNL